jgi:hypothetical protein
MERHGIVPVLVAGKSGTGKSSSVGIIRDEETGDVISMGLPPSRTMIINTEDQPLPIENFNEFTNIYATTWKMIKMVLTGLIDSRKPRTAEEEAELDKRYKENPNLTDPRKIEYVVFDSFTSATEIIDMYCSKVYNGYDRWNQYNSHIRELLMMLKQLPMQSFIMGIPETKAAEGIDDPKEYIKVRGKELKYGFVEKEFVVVLFTNPQFNEDGETTSVLFKFKSNKFDTAKAPPRMFKKGLKNDLFEVAQSIKRFYGLPEDTR